jgi:putative hydrolase
MTDIPFGFNLPGGVPPDPNDPRFAAMMAQLQQLLTSSQSSGTVNWELAEQVATGAARDQDRSLTGEERRTTVDALRLADVWLDEVTSLPSGITAAAGWSRLEWIEATMPTWRRLCDPLAERVVGAMSNLLPKEAAAQLGPMAGMLSGIGGMMFGGQVGNGIGELSTEVLSSSDIGLPLGPAGTGALLPANLEAFTEGLERPADEVRLYVALREAAHQRLYGHVGWVRGYVLDSVDAYARGISVDPDVFEQAVRTVDPSDPESVREALSGGLFTPEDTPAQQAALARLETALALVEGWVAHLVDEVARQRLPGAAALAETFRRRRAEGGPAEQTFATLVGLELRPRRLREAAALWAALLEHRGTDGRDALWGHPDLIPSAEDLDDPDGFARRDDTFDISGIEGLGDIEGPDDV